MLTSFSLVVLVFEAPKGRRKSFDEAGLSGDKVDGGWRWSIQQGQRVKYGEEIGHVVES